MDPSYFDGLTRSVSACSRRGALATLLGGAFGLFGLSGATAKKGKGRGKGKKKKNGKSSSPPPATLAPTCGDGIKNGSETDVDCGGACLRCASTKSCVSRNDCATALCNGGICHEPFSDDECGSDFRGLCYLGQPWNDVSNVCTTSNQTGPDVSHCSSCPPGTMCFEHQTGKSFWCFKPCDAP